MLKAISLKIGAMESYNLILNLVGSKIAKNLISSSKSYSLKYLKINQEKINEL